jgi:competence protein ComGC
MGETRASFVEIVLVAGIAAMILVIARPGIVRDRKQVNEEEAIGALRTLATVEPHYHNRHPSTGYTCSLHELLKDGLIDPRLASGTRSGYRLWSAGCRSSDSKSKANTEFQWFADPLDAQSGTRHFCVDQSKVLRASDIYSGQSCLTLGLEI